MDCPVKPANDKRSDQPANDKRSDRAMTGEKQGTRCGFGLPGQAGQ
ncbi:MAG: hypothetical protein ACOC6P_03060 [Candidatus Aminicenantaceae bacterium]